MVIFNSDLNQIPSRESLKTSFGFSLDLNKFLRLFLIDCGVFFTSLEVSFEAVADKASFPDVCSVDSVECELLKINFSCHSKFHREKYLV